MKMITVSLGSHRFESGPTYHYNASNAGQLVETMFSPDQTADCVNMLPGVDATIEEIQQVAAAGIVRLAVKGSEYEYVPEASKMLLDVCNGDIEQIPKDIFVDPYGWADNRNKRYKLRGSLANTLLDSASVLATRRNNAAETAGIIETGIESDEGIFMIGLANGGIISAAHTFLQLSGENNNLSFVRYSRYKQNDKKPDLSPYQDTRKECLKRTAEGRQVVIYDEDHSSGTTLNTAVEYFANLFGKDVRGIAPVEVGRDITYKPLAIKFE
jgi:hypoxanthine-guanine phosphoribosyltransferase